MKIIIKYILLFFLLFAIFDLIDRNELEIFELGKIKRTDGYNSYKGIDEILLSTKNGLSYIKSIFKENNIKYDISKLDKNKYCAYISTFPIYKIIYRPLREKIRLILHENEILLENTFLGRIDISMRYFLKFNQTNNDYYYIYIGEWIPERKYLFYKARSNQTTLSFDTNTSCFD